VPQLSVVVMAYNEAGSLEAVVHEIHQTLEGLGRPYEVLIVDDGSSDGSAELADRLAETLPGVRVVHHPVNQGLGGVYRTGFAQARGDWITFFPADGQFPAAIIGQFAALMDRADMVLGYLLPERKRSLLGQALSALERLLYRLLFGPLPRFQGVLMFRRSLLDQFALKSSGRGWAVLMELIIRTNRGGYRVLSVPTAMRPRMSGRSKVNNPRTIWANLRQAIALRRDLGPPGASCAARRWLVVALAGAVAALHLWSLLRFPAPFVDEAWFAARAWAFIHTGRPFSTLDAGVFDRFAGYWTFFPWLFTFIQSLSLRLADEPSLQAVRPISLLFGLLLLVAIYAIAARLRGWAYGLLSAALVAVSWPFSTSAHMARPDIIVAALGFGAMALHLADRGCRWWVGLLTGLCVGLAFEVHANGALYGPPLLALHILDGGRATLRQPRFWGFVFGGAVGLAFYAALHVLRYPQTYLALTQLAFGPTHTPPLLTMEPRLIARAFVEMGRLLILTHPLLLPIVIWSLARLLSTRTAEAWRLLTITVGIVITATLLIRNPSTYYAILLTPALDLLAAALVFDVAAAPWHGRWWDYARRGIVWAACVASVVLNLSVLRYDFHETYQAAQARIAASIQPGDSIMGPQTYWFGLYDHPYASWEGLVYYQRYAPDSSLEDALRAFRPDTLVMDESWDYFITDTPDDSPYAQHLRVSRTEMDRFLNRYATLVDRFDNATYGLIRVYHIHWDE